MNTGQKPGEGLLSESLSMTSPAGRREFCLRYDNGSKPVKAISLSVKFPLFEHDDAYCSEPPAWARSVCSGQQSLRNVDADFPTDAAVLSADEFPESGTISTEAQSQAPPIGSHEIFVKSATAAPGGKPLTFACRPLGQEKMASCRTNYFWRDGVHIVYSFTAPPERVDELGRRFDAAVRQLFESLLKQ
jgi:hypothetical protein